MLHRALACGLLSLWFLLAHAGCSGDDDAGNPDGVGNSCVDDGDCETGNCFVRKGFGYCTATCKEEGSTAECPPDSVCKPIQGGERRCLLVCGSESACREQAECGRTYCPTGSSCVDVASSDLSGCEPAPE